MKLHLKLSLVSMTEDIKLSELAYKITEENYDIRLNMTVSLSIISIYMSVVVIAGKPSCLTLFAEDLWISYE